MSLGSAFALVIGLVFCVYKFIYLKKKNSPKLYVNKLYNSGNMKKDAYLDYLTRERKKESDNRCSEFISFNPKLMGHDIFQSSVSWPYYIVTFARDLPPVATWITMLPIQS